MKTSFFLNLSLWIDTRYYWRASVWTLNYVEGTIHILQMQNWACSSLCLLLLCLTYGRKRFFGSVHFSLMWNFHIPSAVLPAPLIWREKSYSVVFILSALTSVEANNTNMFLFFFSCSISLSAFCQPAGCSTRGCWRHEAGVHCRGQWFRGCCCGWLPVFARHRFLDRCEWRSHQANLH